MFVSVPFWDSPFMAQDKQENLEIKPLLWGDVMIIAIECDWGKSYPLATFNLNQRIAESKLIRGILTDDLELVTQAVREEARITQEISVITSNPENPVQKFSVTEAKKYSGKKVTDYLRKIYNEKMFEQYEFSRVHGFHREDMSTSGESFVETILTFDGVSPKIVKESEISLFKAPVLYKGTKIIGILRYSTAKKIIESENLVRGILTNNLDIVKAAVKSGGLIIRETIPVVTQNLIQINFCPIKEALKRHNSEMVRYLRAVNNEQIQQWYYNMAF